MIYFSCTEKIHLIQLYREDLFQLYREDLFNPAVQRGFIPAVQSIFKFLSCQENCRHFYTFYIYILNIRCMYLFKAKEKIKNA